MSLKSEGLPCLPIGFYAKGQATTSLAEAGTREVVTKKGRERKEVKRTYL